MKSCTGDPQSQICSLHNITSELEAQTRFSVTPYHPKGILPSDLTVLCMEPGVSWPDAAWKELGGNHKHDRQKSKWISWGASQRRVIPTWVIWVPLFHPTVLPPPCSSGILSGYIVTFWRKDLLLPHTYADILIIIKLLGPTNKNIWSPGEVLLI